MKKSVLLKVLTAIAACVALGSSPQNAFAQRGGHGGGGGFHGGGGMGFHGGSVGGFIQAATMVTAVDIPMAATMEEPITVGADTTATMAATDGMVATMDGMEDIGVIHTSGLALDGRIGVGDGDTWGYPYGYYGYYNPYYALYPYYSYPDDCPPGYSCPANGNEDPPPANSSPKSGHTPAKPSRPEEKSTPDTDDGSSKVATMSHGSVLSTDEIRVIPSNYRLAHSTTPGNMTIRPEVQNAMRALHEMPPFARQREIETGRYSHLTAEERELLRNVE
jgi:hypothetical protein